MGFVVRLLQALGGHVGVDLGRGQVRVPEQFLHATQIRSRIQHMRRIAVPQFVFYAVIQALV